MIRKGIDPWAPSFYRVGKSCAEVARATERGNPADALALESSQVLLAQDGGNLSLFVAPATCAGGLFCRRI